MKIMTSLVFILLLHGLGNSVKVAIIGKGFGAGLCSYYLRQMIPKIEIDIYNHKPNWKNIFRTYIHSKNLYMNEIVQEKKLGTKLTNNDDVPIIKDGDQIDLFDVKELIGNDPTGYLKLEEFVQQQLEKFEQIYKFQAEGKSFKTVQELLNSLAPEFEEYYTNKTTSSFLEENIPSSVSPGITKFVKSGLLTTCLTDMNAHAFAGLELLLYSGITGQFLLLMFEEETLLKKLCKKRQNFIEKDILKIVRSNDDNINYIIPNDNRPIAYDFIILATVTAAKIKFEGFTKRIKIFEYFEGQITYIMGNLLEPYVLNISHMIINLDKNHTFTKASTKNTYGITKKSMEASKSEILGYLNPYFIDSFGKFDVCPDYVKDKSVRNAKFELGENLYNAHALDVLAVNNEMVAISAKNVALLIKQKIQENITSQEIIGKMSTISLESNPRKKGSKSRQINRKKNAHKKINK